MSNVEKILFVFDFDRTLTLPVWDGKKASTTFSIFRDENLIVPEYTEESKKLFETYHPVEISTSIPLKEKMQKMDEWWKAHLDLFILHKLTRKNIQEAVENGNIRLRGGVKEFFQNAEAKNIPVLVLSAGLGDVIKEILKKEKINDKNILLISNFFEFDELGVAVGYKLPLIHTFNKNETVLPQEILEKFSGRTHVVLAGDSVGDLGMAEGLQVEKLFSFGFPNSTGDEKVFSEKFDIVIPSDEADFSQINYFLQTLGQ